MVRFYFDTVAFRAVGAAFEKEQLASDLKDRILLSPLTLLEVMSQLTTQEGGKVLRQIQAVCNCVNPEHAGLLAWPTDMLAQLWFKKRTPVDDFTKRMEKALNVCLAAGSAAELHAEAGRLRDLLDHTRQSSAQDFGRLLDAARKEPLQGEKFSDAWFRGIANRIKADPSSASLSEIVATLGAYHEFEQNKLKIALQNRDYNPLKHQNDLLDAEQLIYLGDTSLCFLTCDSGFQHLVKKSRQSERIWFVSQKELADAKHVDGGLRVIVELVEESLVSRSQS